jgi:hypothetical protein
MSEDGAVFKHYRDFFQNPISDRFFGVSVSLEDREQLDNEDTRLTCIGEQTLRGPLGKGSPDLVQ